MKRGHKRSLTRKILYSIGGLLIAAAVSAWIFFTYYFEDSVNSFLTPKLQEVVRVATNGRYRLSIGRIVRKDGVFYCTNFELSRVRYDSAESGITLLRLTEDTVRFNGMQIVRLLRGRGSFISSLEMKSPKIYIAEVPPWKGRSKDDFRSPKSSSFPDDLPVISFDSIILSDMQIWLPSRYRPSGKDSFIRGASARLGNFRLDSARLVSEPLLYSEHVDLAMPRVRFDLDGGVYSVEAGPIHANFTDSLLSIDSALFVSNFSEEEFAAREKYSRGRIDIRCADIRMIGFDLENFTQGKRLDLHKGTVGSWSLDYYSDKRKPRNPHAPPAQMPNDLAREFHLPVNIDSLILGNGKIRVRERALGSPRSGVIMIDHVKIGAYPYCTDSGCPNCGKPTRISMTGMFLGEGPIRANIICDFQRPTLDLSVEATVGKFSVKRLNDFLIPNERKEVTDGTVEDGSLTMRVSNGVATTTLLPHYHHLSMKVLTEKAGGKSGLLEGLKSFVANTFVLHSPNMDKYAISGSSVYRRKKEEEFLQFLWIAIRKALGKVIGGFG